MELEQVLPDAGLNTSPRMAPHGNLLLIQLAIASTVCGSMPWKLWCPRPEFALVGVGGPASDGGERRVLARSRKLVDQRLYACMGRERALIVLVMHEQDGHRQPTERNCILAARRQRVDKPGKPILVRLRHGRQQHHALYARMGVPVGRVRRARRTGAHADYEHRLPQAVPTPEALDGGADVLGVRVRPAVVA